MKKRWIGYAVWLMLAACLYFFENNTGTRVVLLCSVIFPFIPPLRSAFFSPDDPEKTPVQKELTVKTFSLQEPDEPGEIRSYVPGDPIRWIHWKLSAKKDDLLVRSMAAGQGITEEKERIVSPDSRKKKKHVNTPAAGISAGILLCVISLLLFPEANRGAQELCNRLFTASEAVNAYAYHYFPVPENQNVIPAAFFLVCIAVLSLTLALIHPGSLPTLGIMAFCACFQVYFGLSFPAWINVPLFGLLAVRMMKRPVNREALAAYFTVFLLFSVLVVFFLPGVNASTEAASENIRDRLAQISEQIAGMAQEAPAGETETRHIHTRSMETGGLEADTEQEFRLETVEEEQISMPRWINWMKVMMLLLLAVALITLPFAPFLLLNARKKKAQESRKAFESENVREAIQAVFRLIILWLEATKHAAGNRLYRDWAVMLPDDLPEDYADRFVRCAADYEESVYSDHPMTEEQRHQALNLLQETETALWKTASRKTRFYLKYWMCLHE